jgi:hypothetical protein
MLTFKQLDTGTPKDIEVTTDDSQAELVEITEVFQAGEMEDYQAAQNLAAATRGADGLWRFAIPGDEAGELADTWNDLATFLDDLNEKLLDGAE